MNIEQVEHAKQLREEGRSFREISEALNVPLSSVHRALKITESNGDDMERSNIPETDEATDKDFLALTVQKALASDDPEKISELLDRLTARQTKLTAMLTEERGNEQQAHTQMQALAGQAVSNDSTIAAKAERDLGEAHSSLVQALAMQTAIGRELALLDRPIKELRSALEQHQKADVEAKQAHLLAEARAKLEATQTAFLTALDEVLTVCREAAEIGRGWNASAKAWKLPEVFPLVGVDAVRKTVAALSIPESKAEAVPSVRVRLNERVEHPRGPGGATILTTIQDAKYLTSTKMSNGEPMAVYIEPPAMENALDQAPADANGTVQVRLNVWWRDHMPGEVVTMPRHEAVQLAQQRISGENKTYVEFV